MSTLRSRASLLALFASASFVLACSGSTGDSGGSADSSTGGDTGGGGDSIAPDGGSDTSTTTDSATGSDSGTHTDSGSATDSGSGGDTATGDDTGTAVDTGVDTGTDAGCVAPKKTCGTSCVDTTSDDANCGGCGIACSGATHCVSSACVCGAGSITCGSACVDPATDSSNCGGCGKACATGETCASGVCSACATGKVVCGTAPGACTDLSSDDANCGACGTACTGGTHCVSGVCKCGTGLVTCGGACVDLSSDPAHCGGCGTACATGATCVSGTCECATGKVVCSGACTDVSSDPTNCGGCGIACGLGSCVSGTCVCGAGQIKCGTKCVDPTSDSSNCGGCGITCATGSCTSGVCPGPTCHSAPPKVLFYGPTGSFESPYLPTGSTVTVADATTWAAMTTADFKGYQLIIIGDFEAGIAPASLWDAANANKATWSAAVDGRIVVSAQDPTYHASTTPASPGASVLLKAELQWLASGPGTALYVGPNYGNRTNLDFLSAFGSWTSVLANANDVHILDTTHPTMIGSTDTSLSNWSLSMHDVVTSFPSGFKAVTQQTSVPGNSAEVVREVSCTP